MGEMRRSREQGGESENVKELLDIGKMAKKLWIFKN